MLTGPDKAGIAMRQAHPERAIKGQMLTGSDKAGIGMRRDSPRTGGKGADAHKSRQGWDHDASGLTLNVRGVSFCGATYPTLLIRPPLR